MLTAQGVSHPRKTRGWFFLSCFLERRGVDGLTRWLEPLQGAFELSCTFETSMYYMYGPKEHICCKSIMKLLLLDVTILVYKTSVIKLECGAHSIHMNCTFRAMILS